MYKLLIVEDDETIAGAVAKHLEGWGYHCVLSLIHILRCRFCASIHCFMSASISVKRLF